MRKVGEAERESLDLSSWQVAFNGAEPVRAGTLRRFAAAFAPCGFRAAAFCPCYGLAEATLLVSGWCEEGIPGCVQLDAEALERHEAENAEMPRTPRGAASWSAAERPCRPSSLVDPESAEPCPPGRVGEIWVAGPSVARGYWERPEETAATFGARLADGTGPFLRTGDLGFVAEGELFLTGRLKDLIILRGRNHYPQDLELTAERSHADLRAGGGAAFAVDLAAEERLVIVHEMARHALAGMEAGKAEEIAAAVRRGVAEEHEASVAEVVLIRPETLPRTSSGKVRRSACRDLYLQGGLRVVGASRLSAIADTAADEDPWSGSQVGSPDWLRRTFAAAARIDPERVDADLPLSAAGLDSLAAVELKQTVEEVAGVFLPLADLLEGMTLARAGAAGGRGGHGGESGDAASVWHRRSGRRAPALLEPALALVSPSPGARELRLQHRRRGAARADLLRSPGPRAPGSGGPPPDAARHVRRHARRSGAANGERVAAGFETVDATGWSDAEVHARLHAEAYRPFDLAAGPLLRAVLLRHGDRGGRPSSPSPCTTLRPTSGRWPCWPASSARSRRGDARPLRRPCTPTSPAGKSGCWRAPRESGCGSTGGSAWPARRSSTCPPTGRGVRCGPCAADRGPLPPSAERAEAVHRLAAAHGCTPFVALLAAWQAVLSRWSGQEEFLTGAPMAGRSAREWGEVVGYFVNLVPLRADLAGDPATGELMARTRGTVLDALEHQDLPFALLTERLQPERDPSRPPLVAAMLTYEKAPAPELAALAAFAVGVPGARLDLGGLSWSRSPSRHPPRSSTSP